MDWWLAPIDPSRVHEVGFAVSWHARSMTLAWAVIAPSAVMAARFLKVLPGQDWPRELDTQVWWRSHWMGQAIVILLTVFGLGLILGSATGGSVHGVLGYATILLAFFQVVLGIFRGSKGGPTAPAPDGSLRGDHYDMTPWRRMFEWVHKVSGYALLALAAATVVFGLWEANAPRWMWALIAAFWTLLATMAMILQHQGWAIDTYQAIWGPGQEHPGNRRKPIGWGIRRPQSEEKDHVRSH